MKKLAIALIGLCLTAASAQADPLHQQAVALTQQSAPIIIGRSGLVDGERHLDIEMSAFPHVSAVDPLVDIGSLTKFVTAVVVLHMVEAGEFTLKAKLSELLPNVPEDKRDITIHQLLTHSSGLIESTGSDEEVLGRDTFLNRLLVAPLAHPVGAQYLYSNAGYSLLAAIVEVKAGMSFDAYLNQHVLAANDLPAMGYQIAYDPALSMKSGRSWRTWFQPSAIAEASWGGPTPGWNLIGNGGAVATAEGFLLFWDAFYSGRIVAPSLVDLALTPHVDEGDGDTFYGYGLVVEQSADHGLVYWHDGGNDLFSAEWRHLSGHDTTLFTAGLSDDAFIAMEHLLDQLP